MQALDLIPRVAARFRAAFGRDSGGLVRRYRTEDAETIVVALGSVLGTIEDVVDELRDAGVKSARSGSSRSGRSRSTRSARRSGRAQRVVVLEKALAVGIGGIVGQNVRMALSGIHLRGYTVIAGLGGRAITKRVAARLLRRRLADRLEALTFLDLDRELVERELGRMRDGSRPARTPRTSCATSASSPREPH